MYTCVCVFEWLRCCLVFDLSLQLNSGPANYAEEITLCLNKSLSPVSKEIGILASHSQDIPVVASAFAHTKSSDGLLDIVNKSYGLHLRIEL